MTIMKSEMMRRIKTIQTKLAWILKSLGELKKLAVI